MIYLNVSNVNDFSEILRWTNLTAETMCSIDSSFSTNQNWYFNWSFLCDSELDSINQENIHTIVQLWSGNQEYVIETYGHISDWDVSNIYDMSGLFSRMSNFDFEISNWNVSNVQNMSKKYV